MMKLALRIVYLFENGSNKSSRNYVNESFLCCLLDCGLTIKVWDVTSNDISLFTPISRSHCKEELRKLFYEVYCEVETLETENVPEYSNFDNYSKFLNDWFRIVPNYFPQKKPLINFTSEDAYRNSRIVAHESVCVEKVAFGTLVDPTTYVEHSRNDPNQIVKACFLHDTFELCVQIRQPDERGEEYIDKLGQRKKYHHDNFRLNYSSVVRIIANNQNDLILEINNSPTLYHGSRRVIEFNYTQGFQRDVVGRSNAICFSISDPYVLEEIISRIHSVCNSNGPLILYNPFVVKLQPIPAVFTSLKNPTLMNMEFSCRFLIEALLRRNCRLQLGPLEAFLQLVHKSWLKNSFVTEEALSELVYLVDTGHFYDCVSSFKILLQSNFKLWHINKSKLSVVPANTIKIRRVIITPTRILLWPPEICVKNRILKNFNADFSLRVSFRDDDYFKINHHLSIENVVVYETIEEILIPGIIIGGRHFKFLGWSTSQICDHELWMYCVDNDRNTTESIRKWMGDFSHIGCVATYTARMAQCFSNTEESLLVIQPTKITIEDDIEGGLNPVNGKPYCFSDGVGRISEKALNEVLEKLEMNRVLKPSALQIQFGGKKGMLVVDPTLKDQDIVFRKSMDKFPCDYQALEIYKLSSPKRLFLNRPLINILNQNGIESQVFLQLQEEALLELTDMFFDDKKAARYLSEHRNFGLNVHDLVNAGISPNFEPFLRNMLLATCLTEVDKILVKANLPIKPSEGRNVFGVVDETGSLNYGEIYLQITNDLSSRDGNRETSIIEGPVVISTNPCQQSGDVRILMARDIPALSHIRDCVVFPQKGSRPHPNELAGSDLDGDEYYVIWRKDLIFKENKPPRELREPKRPLLGRPIKVDDMIEFFCHYITNNNIGIVANAHLVFADSEKHGIESEICKMLARKCHIAVDFLKNGEKVNLLASQRPSRYPDFMQKSHKDVYKSKRALGSIFRTCQMYSNFNLSTDKVYSNVTLDPRMNLDGWRHYEQSAILSKEKYSHRLEAILVTYGIRNESEAITGCFSNFYGQHKNTQYTNRRELEENIKLSIEHLVTITREDFMEEFSGMNLTNFKLNILRKASSWYMITYSEKNPKILSFPWIVGEHLWYMKLNNAFPKTNTVSIDPEFNKLSLQLNIELKSLPTLNTDTIKLLISVASPNCPLLQWVNASQMLIQWMNYNNLTNICQLNSTEMVKLLIHSMNVSHTPPTSAIMIIAQFLKFFMTLQFKAKGTLTEYLPFKIQAVKALAKESMVTYRELGITQTFEGFGCHTDVASIVRTIEMKPFPLSLNAIGKTYSEFILQASLLKWSGCEEVRVRKDFKNLTVSAWGTSLKIKRLERILKKGSQAIFKSLSKRLNPLKEFQ